MIKYHIVVPKGISKAVFESQVLEKFSGLDTKLYSFSENSNVFGYEVNRVIKNVNCNDVIYFRSVVDFAKYRLTNAKKCKLVFDFRGIISEESFFKNSSIPRKVFLKSLEWLSYNYSDEVWTVSNNLKSYLISRYNYKDVKVFPCKIANKYIINKKLVKKESIDFIYVGSMSKWQCFENVCRTYNKIKNSKTTLTVLTRDIDTAHKILSDFSISANVSSCDRDDIFNELDKADFGFVLRDSNIINLTASPIKVVEYASRGVIPIMTSSVGDYSSELKYLAINIDEQELDIKAIQKYLTQSNLDKIYAWSLKYSW